jgi:hypothetical protein
MKKYFIYSVLMFSSLLIHTGQTRAQDNGQKKLHIVIEQNGKKTIDTTLLFNKSATEEEIQGVIATLTGEDIHACPNHKNITVHCDTTMHKCKHTSDTELDSLLIISGKPCMHMHSDSCRHSSCKGETAAIHTEKVIMNEESEGKSNVEVTYLHISPGDEPLVIEEDGDYIIIKKGEGSGEKCIKVITKEGNEDTLKTEKVKIIRITETEDMDMNKPCEGNKVVEKKITVTTEGGDKAVKSTIKESPAKTEKSQKKSK